MPYKDIDYNLINIYCFQNEYFPIELGIKLPCSSSSIMNDNKS